MPYDFDRITLRGTTEPQIQRRVVHFDPERGHSQTLDYDCITQEQVEALSQQYEAAGIAYELIYEQGGKGKLQVNDTTQNFLVDTWEVNVEEDAKDQFYNPTFQKILNKYFGSDQTDNAIIFLKSIRDYLGFGNGLDLDSVFGEHPGNLLDEEDQQTVSRYIKMALSGSTDYRESNYTVIHTTNVPNRWQGNGNIADVGVGQIYTMAQFLTEVKSKLLWAYAMPDRLSDKLLAIPAPDTKPFYLWGWLKSPSVESTSANNRVNIVTTYTLAQISLDKYDPYIPAH